MIAWQQGKDRFGPNAGIAIGPILFIIAILGILAAAIAAGSGSFTSGTSSESARTKASALIQIGENLKIGMDRITMEGGLDPTAVNTDVTATNAASDLFSPTGGGIAPPSVGMANNPAVDIWYFPKGPVKGLGTGADNVLAVLPVSKAVCAEVNNRSVGVANVPSSAAALGDFTANTVTGSSAWPTKAGVGVNLVGVATGCVYNNSVADNSAAGTTAPSTQYFYYQVLAIQ